MHIRKYKCKVNRFFIFNFFNFTFIADNIINPEEIEKLFAKNFIFIITLLKIKYIQ